MILNAILLALYAFIMLYIAYTSLQYNDNMTNFLVAGRDQKKYLVVFSMLASTVGGGLVLGSVTRTYTMGFPAFWLVAAGGIAHYLQGIFLASKVRETEALTLSDLADKLVGPKVRVLTSVIIVITWVGIATSQFVAAASVLANLTHASYQVAIFVVGAFLVIYTLMGGQKTVMKTDFIQFGILAIAMLATISYLYIGKPPAPNTIVVNLFSADFGPTNLIYYLLVMGGSYFICPMMFTRCLSAESPIVARKSTFISGTGMLIYAFIITFIGLWAKASITDLQDQLPLNLIAQSYLPSILGGLLVFGILSAIVSTADTVLITAAGTFQKDIIGKDSVFLVRVWVVVVGVIACFIGLFYTDIIGIIMKTYNGYTAGIVPPLFLVIMYVGKKRLNEWLVFIAIVVGYAIGLTGSFMTAGSQAAYVLPIVGLCSSALIALAAVYFAPAQQSNIEKAG
jgi:solute:Na+ symporter, SSS family